MEKNLKLFVHGVPKGQQIWNPQEDDRLYIESFYGRKANVEVQLLVEIIQTSNNDNCYYTYYRNVNILDNDNRPGAYFALTVRSNAYYTDLANMYNILDAAYHKFVLNTIIKSDASVTKFIVQNFDQVDKQLQDVEKEITHYLSFFSIDTDFVGLNGFKVNPEYDAETINLIECNSKSLLDYVRTKGNLSVSPLHPTNEVAELTKKKNEEIESIKSQSQQQISKVQYEADQKLKIAIEGKEKNIEAIRKEYSSADKTITGLKKQLEAEKSSIASLNSELDKHKEERKKNESTKHELATKKQELDNAYQILSSVKQSFSAWNGVVKGAAQLTSTDPKKTVFEKLNKFLLLGYKILVLVLLLVIVFNVWKSTSTARVSSQKLNNLKVQIDQLNTKLKEAENQLTQRSTMNTVVPEISNTNEIIAVYPDAKIDITELSPQNPTMRISTTYHISIQKATGGSWKSDDFTIIGNNTIIPNKIGDCKISYVINNKVASSRTINVVN